MRAGISSARPVAIGLSHEAAGRIASGRACADFTSALTFRSVLQREGVQIMKIIVPILVLIGLALLLLLPRLRKPGKPIDLGLGSRPRV